MLGRRSQSAPSLSDDEIVHGVLAGDTALYEVLVRRYNERVFRTARAVLGRDDDVEEAAQEAWVHAWSHLADFEGRARFSTWLLRITVRAAIGCGRKRCRLLRWPTNAGDGEAEDWAMRGPSHAASNAEIRRAIEQAVDRLPATLRTAFVLREVEGLSTAASAAVLDVSESALKVRLHRARRALRKDLERRIGAEPLA